MKACNLCNLCKLGEDERCPLFEQQNLIRVMIIEHKVKGRAETCIRIKASELLSVVNWKKTILTRLCSNLHTNGTWKGERLVLKGLHSHLKIIEILNSISFSISGGKINA